MTCAAECLVATPLWGQRQLVPTDPIGDAVALVVIGLAGLLSAELESPAAGASFDLLVAVSPWWHERVGGLVWESAHGF